MPGRTKTGVARKKEFEKVKDSFIGKTGVYEQYLPTTKCKVMIRDIEIGDWGVKIYLEWLDCEDDRERIGAGWDFFVFMEHKLAFSTGIMGWRILFD